MKTKLCAVMSANILLLLKFQGSVVQIYLIYSLIFLGVAMHVAKAALDSGFSAKGNNISAGSLKYVIVLV